LAEGISVETVGIAIPGKELQGQPFILWVFVVFFFFFDGTVVGTQGFKPSQAGA
jgi:hypothetical protein